MVVARRHLRSSARGSLWLLGIVRGANPDIDTHLQGMENENVLYRFGTPPSTSNYRRGRFLVSYAP